MPSPIEPPPDPDLQYHYTMYRGFVRWSLVFAAHVLVILAALAYFFV
jgi:hypothetical protein